MAACELDAASVAEDEARPVPELEAEPLRDDDAVELCDDVIDAELDAASVAENEAGPVPELEAESLRDDDTLPSTELEELAVGDDVPVPPGALRDAMTLGVSNAAGVNVAAVDVAVGVT